MIYIEKRVRKWCSQTGRKVRQNEDRKWEKFEKWEREGEEEGEGEGE